MFHRRFGGSLGRYIQKNGRVIYQWYVCHSNASEALAVFAELCVEKSEQAKLAGELCGLLFKNRAKGRRKRGAKIIGDAEYQRRGELADRITLLKHTDA